MNSSRAWQGTLTAQAQTVVLLARHATTDAVGLRLAGRAPNHHLNARGRAETQTLAARLARAPLAAVYSSPLERACETATAVAARHGLAVRRCDGLIEVDFGEWTGATFDALATRDDWRRYNEHRGVARVPGGESASETQRRIARTLAYLHQQHPGAVLLAVTHAELVRYAILLARGAPLDDWHRVEVKPAEVVALSCDSDNVSEARAWRQAG